MRLEEGKGGLEAVVKYKKNYIGLGSCTIDGMDGEIKILVEKDLENYFLYSSVTKNAVAGGELSGISRRFIESLFSSPIEENSSFEFNVYDSFRFMGDDAIREFVYSFSALDLEGTVTLKIKDLSIVSDLLSMIMNKQGEYKSEGRN
jgi:hypothetical protein